MSLQIESKINGPLMPGGWSRWKNIAPLMPFSRETYRVHANRGKLPSPVRLGGRVTIYSNDEINAWLATLRERDL